MPQTLDPARMRIRPNAIKRSVGHLQFLKRKFSHFIESLTVHWPRRGHVVKRNALEKKMNKKLND